LEVSTDYGYDIAIYEEDLEGITVGELWKLRISRSVLKRCFAEGLMLMRARPRTIGYARVPTRY
jgi:hypothetical protein